MIEVTLRPHQTALFHGLTSWDQCLAFALELTMRKGVAFVQPRSCVNSLPRVCVLVVYGQCHPGPAPGQPALPTQQVGTALSFPEKLSTRGLFVLSESFCFGKASSF